MEKIHPSITEIGIFLEEHALGFSDLQSIGLGEWSLAYQYRHKEKQYVIRLSTFDEDFRKDMFAYRFSTENLPIPKIIQFGRAFDGFYAISEKALGVAIDLLDEEEMKKVVPSVVNILDGLRLADVSDTSGFGAWGADGNGRYSSWKEFLLTIKQDDPQHRIFGWRDKLKTTFGVARFDALYGQLATMVVEVPEKRYLIHADLLHYNLLVDQNQVSAVIDWGCAQYGDFLYDLAWFTFWSSWHPAMEKIDFKKVVYQHYKDIGLEVLGLETRLKAYELHIGLDAIAYSSFIENWEQVEKVTSQAEHLNG
jgi:hygromycin-B 4-O-kinase